MHRNEVTNSYYRIKWRKRRIENSTPRLCPKFTFTSRGVKKDTNSTPVISIELIYTAGNFNTQPPKLHEDDGRRSMYTHRQPSRCRPCWADPDCSVRTRRLWGFVLARLNLGDAGLGCRAAMISCEALDLVCRHSKVQCQTQRCCLSRHRGTQRTLGVELCPHCSPGSFAAVGAELVQVRGLQLCVRRARQEGQQSPTELAWLCPTCQPIRVPVGFPFQLQETKHQQDNE